MAGTISFTLVYPLDYTRCMIAVNKVPSHIKFTKIFMYLKNRDGFFKMYRGLGASLISTVPYGAFKFFFFEQYKKQCLAFK